MPLSCRTWMCLVCGWTCEEAVGIPEDGILSGTRWAGLSIDWVCPECGVRKENSEMIEI